MRGSQASRQQRPRVRCAPPPTPPSHTRTASPARPERPSSSAPLRGPRTASQSLPLPPTRPSSSPTFQTGRRPTRMTVSAGEVGEGPPPPNLSPCVCFFRAPFAARAHSLVKRLHMHALTRTQSNAHARRGRCVCAHHRGPLRDPRGCALSPVRAWGGNADGSCYPRTIPTLGSGRPQCSGGCSLCRLGAYNLIERRYHTQRHALPNAVRFAACPGGAGRRRRRCARITLRDAQRLVAAAQQQCRRLYDRRVRRGSRMCGRAPANVVMGACVRSHDPEKCVKDHSQP